MRQAWWVTNTTEARQAETAQTAAVQLGAVLALVDRGDLRCSAKTRRPSQATVRLLAEALPGGDYYGHEPIRSYAWPLILQAGGLAEGPRLQLTPRGRAAARKDPREVLEHLWRRWVKAGIIDEFSRVEAIKGQRGTNVLSGLARRRAEAAEGLDLLPSGEWVQIDDLFARMRRDGLDPAVHRSGRALFRLYLEHPEHGSLGYDGYHEWEILQGRYVMAVLFEYAATLGLIDVSYVDPVGARGDFRDQWGGDDLEFLSRYDGLRAVRLNDFGAQVLYKQSLDNGS